MSNKELIKAGHALAKSLDSDTPLLDIAKQLSDLASALDVQTARANALAAENASARNAVQTFCDVIQSNTDAICEEVGPDGVNAILSAMSATGTMLATDSFLTGLRNEARAEGINFAASRLAAAYNHGFIDKPLSEVGDVVRMILTSKEDLAFDPLPGDDGLSGEYAEKALTGWASQLCEGKAGEVCSD